MKKKILLVILAVVCLFMVNGCGKETTEGDGGSKEPVYKPVLKTDEITIDGMYVDESFEDENLDLVYLFFLPLLTFLLI